MVNTELDIVRAWVTDRNLQLRNDDNEERERDLATHHLDFGGSAHGRRNRGDPHRPGL